ncbi:unnamed protein product [Allacma fusca]|uniref:F-box domain-containing protein n=1 Tax=Allacma fusca TaxID=39272 RepID=A0A8J2L4J7_9HEXA|nr:unnamed protein product [Allacma fusca]
MSQGRGDSVCVQLGLMKNLKFQILEKILSFLPFKDLLSSSLVNQRWCRMSRWEIQRSRKCYAKIATLKACHEMLRFILTFKNCLILPFSGLELIFHSNCTTNCLSLKNNRLFESSALIKTLPIRRLKARMNDAAPKLQVIGGIISLEDLPKILSMKKGNLITKFWLDSILKDSNPEAFLGFMEAKPKLRELPVCEQYICTKQWLRILTMFVESTCYALQKLHIQHFDVLLITKESRLPNLKHLVVDFDMDSQLGLVSIRKINYELLFPNLQIFTVSVSRHKQVDLEQELPSNFLDQNELFSCFTVKRVEMSNDYTSKRLPQSMYESLVSAFPNVLALKIEYCSSVMPYLCMWENIESIDIKCQCYGGEINDALICGISNEEIKYLQSLEVANPGVLQHLQIVPTSQPLLSMNKYIQDDNRSSNKMVLPSRISSYIVLCKWILSICEDARLEGYSTVELNWPESSTAEDELDSCCSGDVFLDLRKFVRFSPEVASFL